MRGSRFRVDLLTPLLLLGLGAGSGGLAAQATLDVPGVVLDHETRDGIPDVILRVDGIAVSAATDADGAFVLRDVPTGAWTLQVDHVAYGSHSHDVILDASVDVRLEIRLAQEAIELAPIVVDGETSLERRRRRTGASFWEVNREEIVEAIGTSQHMGDLIRQTVPGLKLRQASNLSRSDICLEFRAAASISIVNNRSCNHPMVLMDGVVVSDPQYLYGIVGLDNLERIEVMPPGEAGVRYGTGSLYGVILIETRRPGRSIGAPGSPALGMDREAFTFDWTRDPAGHSTGKTLLGSALGNAAGMAAGLAIAQQCIEITDNDELDSSCGAGRSVLAGTAAVILPAVGSAFGARWAGGTDTSVGRLVPALLGAGMMLFPGYAFSLSTVGGDQPTVNAVGNVFLAAGVPLAVTLADRLFRKLR